jgi:hypothetical protein
MLDYNKIRSSINSGNYKKLELIEFIGLTQSTFYDKLKRKSFTPNELEKIADYFKRPISYYFDREEPDSVYEEKANYEINRSVNCTNCPECISKQKEIDALKKALDATEELLEMYRGKKSKGKCG